MQSKPVVSENSTRMSRKLPPVCFGTWQAAGWSSTDDGAFSDTLEAALASGVTCIDTAPAYGKGHAETLVGKAISVRDRSGIFLASKFNHYESSPARVRLSLDRTLARVGSDYLDLYQQHWPGKKPAFSQTLESLLELKSAGRIRHIGVCNWTEAEFARLTDAEIDSIDTLQVCFSLLWRANEGWLKDMAARGVGILVYSPLAQGILADDSVLQRRQSDHRTKNILFASDMRQPVSEVLTCMTSIADRHGTSLSSVALAWLMQQPWISTVIVGQSRPVQLAENLQALSLTLSGGEVEELEEVSRQFANRFTGYDTMWGWHSLRPGST